MKNEIRLIPIIEECGAMQMAIDEAILKSCSEGKSLPALRFYRFIPPAITIGYHQNINDFDLNKIKEKGFHLVRRITGGTAVLHKNDFVYSLILPEKGIPHKVLDAYNYLSEGLVKGLNNLGIKAYKRKILSKKREGNCYLNDNPYDIIVKHKKISGNAQTRLNGFLLQHGTIILDDNIQEIIECQNISEKQKKELFEKSKRKVGCIKDYLGTIPSFSELEEAMKKGFQSLFSEKGWILKQGQLTSYEKKLAEKIVMEKDCGGI
ncbi:MAG: lipoate--protein ligase family protein [Candidatus Pacearchaeota archaeon]